MTRAEDGGHLRSLTLSSLQAVPWGMTEKRIRRQLVRVPRDQQSLLMKGDAWFESLRREVNGHVPPAILQNLKVHHETPQQTPPTQESASLPEPSPSLPPGGSLAAPATNPSLEAPPTAGQRQEAISDDEEASVVSWSPSPQRPGPQDRAPAGEDLEPADQDEPQSSPMRRVDPPSDADTPPAAIPLRRPSFPSSDSGSEIELEVEVPGVLDHPLQPVNRLAQPEPTPPSAQVIPCSYSGTSSLIKPSSPPKPVQRKMGRIRRPMKQVVFPEEIERRFPPTKRAVRPLEPKPLSSLTATSPDSIAFEPTPLRLELQSSPALATSSSLLVPGTTPVMPGPPTNLTPTPPPAGTENIRGQETSPIPATVEHSPSSEDGRANQEAAETPLPKEKLQSLDEAPKEDLAREGVPQLPFDAFTSAYPEYKGTIDDFIRACISIWAPHQNRKYLLHQNRKYLSSYQCDHAIACFLDYIVYVEETPFPRQPMMFIDWYHWKDFELPVQFSKGVVTRQNLDAVRAAYAEEANSIMQSVHGAEDIEDDSDEEASSVAPTSPTSPTTEERREHPEVDELPSILVSPEKFVEAGEGQTVRETVEVSPRRSDTSYTITSSPAKLPSPRPGWKRSRAAENPQTPVSIRSEAPTTSSDIREGRSEQSKPNGALPKAIENPRLREPSPALPPHLSPRLELPSFLSTVSASLKRKDSISSTAASTASTTSKKRRKLNPQERREKFKEFIAKKYGEQPPPGQGGAGK